MQSISAYELEVMIDPQGPFCINDGLVTLTANPNGGNWSGDVSSDSFDPSAGPGLYEIIYEYTDPTGCIGADTIYIVVKENSSGTESYVGCSGDGYSVLVNGTSYDESNPSGTEVLVNSLGCDSIVTVFLLFNNTSTGSETYIGCTGDGYSVTVNGTIYNETNPTGIDTLVNSLGCDSIVTITLQFNNTSTDRKSTRLNSSH